MKTLLSVLVAAVFAATGFNAVAQSKDVTTKSGEAAKAKDGTAGQTHETKGKPKGGAAVKPRKPRAKHKGGELPRGEKREPKKKAEPSKVKTKDGGTVKSKDGA